MNLESSWFAVQTRPKCEKSVAATLDMKGYESFYPIYWEKRQWSDRYVQMERPLFPSYVFCRVTSEAYGKVVLTSGVIRLLGFGGTPSEIPATQIESLRRVNESPIGRAPWTYMPTGTRIRIESGPLRGVEGVCLQNPDERRLILSVDMLQRSVAVTLDPQVAIRVVPPSQ
jgi:transcription antitermination factor NusG